MKALRKLAVIIVGILASVVMLNAQKQASAPPPQTPRQALLEMLNGGQSGVMKHLTVDVQQLLSKPENKQGAIALAMFGSLKSQGDFQVFETGPVLLAVNQADQQKFEIRVESDDLNGDQDAMELSLHLLRDGQEQHDDLGYFSSRLSVNMIRQQDIWRLSSIRLGFEVPLGDPEFVKQTFLKSMNSSGATGIGIVGPATAGSDGSDVLRSQHESTLVVVPASPEARTTLAAAELQPEQLIVMLGLAESSFARAHADAGFSCSLSDLAEAGAGFGLEQKISGGVYNGYKLNLTGCEGKPAASFQISLEPVAPGAAGKAYCIDATQNVRISDDGRGATCLTSGRVENAAQDPNGAGEWKFSVGQANKPRE